MSDSTEAKPKAAKKKTTKKKVAKKATRKKTSKKATRKNATAKKKATKKTSKKATRKKGTEKKATRKKTATKPRKSQGKRAPQGKRLGAWKLVKRKAVFDWLKDQGVTIAALAGSLGVGASAVHAWKAGRRFPSEEAQRKLGDLVAGKAPVPQRRARKPRKGKKAAFDGALLRATRERLVLTRAAVAKELGVSVGSLRNWEVGSSVPRGANREAAERFVERGSGASNTPPPAVSQPSGPVSASAVHGAAQVAAAYVAAGNRLSPNEVVAFVGELREALS